MPVTYLNLVTRIREGSISAEELKAYFLPGAPIEPTFAPTFALNELEVDISGLERVARISANELAYQGSIAVRVQRLKEIAFIPPDGTIIAEGDSWFNLPNIYDLVPPTLIDLLSIHWPINNIAHWGDTLIEIVLSGEYISYLATGRVNYFIFSGGGNDVLGGGELERYIRQRVSGDNDPANAPLYVRRSYYEMADNLEVIYRSLLTAVGKLSPNTVTIIHGYDYCLPRRDGRWLGAPLMFRGFDPVYHPEFARAIVRVLVDDFNIRLARLARSLPNVKYIDLRNTLGEDDWWDELHANADGAQKLAARFEPLLPRALGAQAVRTRKATAPKRKPGKARRVRKGSPSV